MEKNCRYIVEGFTEAGNKFRPSDWIDRVASMGATYDSQRLIYNDHLHPESLDGQKCLVFDTTLEAEHPELFRYVLNFVQSNQLKHTKICDLPAEKIGGLMASETQAD